LIAAIDGVGFLGDRILYLHPDISPPYFRKPYLDPNRPLPPFLPHKKNPLITRQFIDERVRENGLTDTCSLYLARCWVRASYAAQWFQSKGIAMPGLVSELVEIRTTTRSRKKEASPGTGTRGQKLRRTKLAIQKLGATADELTVTELHYRVAKQQKADGLPEPSLETVRRAMGKRKD
jgi:hypothetical protein